MIDATKVDDEMKSEQKIYSLSTQEQLRAHVYVHAHRYVQV